jgi:hypothetical protein
MPAVFSSSSTPVAALLFFHAGGRSPLLPRRRPLSSSSTPDRVAVFLRELASKWRHDGRPRPPRQVLPLARPSPTSLRLRAMPSHLRISVRRRSEVAGASPCLHAGDELRIAPAASLRTPAASLRTPAAVSLWITGDMDNRRRGRGRVSGDVFFFNSVYLLCRVYMAQHTAKTSPTVVRQSSASFILHAVYTVDPLP